MTKADIQLVRALADKRGRTEHGLFVAEGEKLIGELRGIAPLRPQDLRAGRAFSTGPEVETVAPRDMERLSLLKTAEQLAGARRDRPAAGWTCRSGSRGRLTLALDDVQNPGNLGTIVRLADWFGIADIVCSEASADCFNPKVVQATMGAILRVRVHYTDLAALLSERRGRRRDCRSAARFWKGRTSTTPTLTAGGHRRDGQRRARHHRTPWPAPSRRSSSSRPGRPTAAGSESLNVAMATGIVCW